ncbi:MAG: putative toxin-antitoxin system toxin component, PIN family [Verrucomicrobia bacterium]|nr:MAG: putative toxin-antitoxin system toxin component, PIN family [Verrucomicrobiota bacterium]
MRAFLDANVVFAGARWRGEARRCLVAMARRKVITFATSETLGELRQLANELAYKCPNPPFMTPEWYYRKVTVVSPAPLGKQRRDPKDDPYLACALAARAQAIVSRDEDLLVLEKPFGIEIVTPRELLVRLTRSR